MIKDILIIDDEASFVSSFAKALCKVCHFQGNVKTAGNGDDALQQLRDTRYDLCFLDIHLPDANGLEIMEQIKLISPGTKVVIMTGDDLDDNIRWLIQKYASMFISKPIDLDAVRSIIEQMNEEKNVVGGSREKRRYPRMQCRKIVHYAVSDFDHRRLRSGLTAEITDMSEGGAGLRTQPPIAEGNVLGFEDDFQYKKGIVRWSAMEGEKYRAGIEFL